MLTRILIRIRIWAMKKMAFKAVFIIATLFLGLFGLSQTVSAGEILFEMPSIYGLETISFGNNNSLYGSKVAEFIFPHGSGYPGVCEVGLFLARSGNPTDGIELEIYKGSLGVVDPEAGELVAQATISSSFLPTNIGQKTIFKLNRCFDFNATSPEGFFEGWFVLSRTNSNSQGEYLAQTVPFNIFGNMWFANEDINGVWQKNDFRELRFTLETSTPVPPKEPIIIIPGIMGSYLNRVDNGEEVWPNASELIKPGDDSYLLQTLLDDNGNEILDIKSTGILGREFLIYPFYETLVQSLENNGYTQNEDLIIFHYDWRQDINIISLQLEGVINTKSLSSPTGKVSIIAHSMGGLVVKEYLKNSQNDLSKINKVILAGTPQLGAVKAFKLLNFGDNLNIQILNSDTAKDISQNMPAVYELLPSREYIDGGTSYLKDYRGGKKVGNELPYNEINDFMLNDNYLDKGFRNETLLDNADQFHQDLDNIIIDGPEVYNLIGCSEKTLTSIELHDKKKVDVELDKGDGTVPLKSARQGFAVGQTNYFAKDFNHFDLVSDGDALDTINSIILGDNFSSNKISTSDTICDYGKFWFLFSTHSPVNLKVYDSGENYVGLNPDGDVNLGIEDGDFMQIGENNFILVPADETYRVIVEAYDTGSFDFKVRILSDNTKDEALYYEIPITDPNLNAELVFGGDLDELLLGIDENGDGSFDKTIGPNFRILETEPMTVELIMGNVEGAYALGWIDGKVRDYIIKRLEQIVKLQDKDDESKTFEIIEILNDLLIKIDGYLERGLINNEAYGIIVRDLHSLNNE